MGGNKVGQATGAQTLGGEGAEGRGVVQTGVERTRSHPLPPRSFSKEVHLQGSWSQVLYSSAWQEDKRQLI